MNIKNILSIALVVSLSFVPFASALTIDSIDFKEINGAGQIVISADGPLSVSRDDNAEDNQVILDIAGANLGKMAKRRLVTSSFNTPLTLIAPYAVDGGARIVLQLKETTSVDVSEVGNTLKIGVGGTVQNDVEPSDSFAESDSDPEASEEGSNDGLDADLESDDFENDGLDDAVLENVSMGKAANTNEPKPATPSDSEKPYNKLGKAARINKFIDSRKTQNFSGKPITLKVREADVRDVLRLIGEASGFNIIIGSGVKGTLTLSLANVPWDQVLDVVLHTLKLGAERNFNVLRVLTLINLTQEKQQELAARKAAEASSPRITKVFPISYADLDSISKILTTFGKSGLGGPSGGSTPTIDVDNRTNSVIVQDIAENINRVTKLIELLDTQTPQVMVEAKIVEATENFSKTLGGSLGFGSSGDTQYLASFGKGNPTDKLIGSPGQFPSGAAFAESAAGKFGTSINLGLFLPGVDRLNAIIDIGETESQVKVVSSPKTVVLNKEKANIVQSIPVLLRQTIQTEAGPLPFLTQVDGNISLDVTPTVTNDESVLLDLKVSRDVPIDLGENQAIGRRNIDTKVLVESGSTLVIGGIYTLDKTHAESGFPLLRQVPIIGLLFGSKQDSIARSEIFMFITPKILNVKKSGLSG